MTNHVIYLDACSAGLYKCNTTATCIPTPWVCDSERDCEDGSDESPATCLTGCYRFISCALQHAIQGNEYSQLANELFNHIVNLFFW